MNQENLMSTANMNSLPQSVIAPNEIPSTEPLNPATEIPVSTPIEKKVPVRDVNTERFVHLSKKEAALVKERESFKKEQESFKAQQAEYDKYRKAYEMVNEIAELQKTDEIAAMRKAGFSDNAIMNLMAQAEDNSTPEEKAMKMAKTEIDKFRAEQAQLQEATEKKAIEARKSEDEKAITRYKGDIDNHIKTASDKLEYCSFYGEAARELIYETVSSILQDSNEMVSIDEAAQMVEDYYEEQDKAMNSLKKRSSHFAKKAPPAAPVAPVIPKEQSKIPANRVEAKQFVDNRPPTKTLSNKMSPALSSTAESYISPEQNKQRVLEKYASLMKR